MIKKIMSMVVLCCMFAVSMHASFGGRAPVAKKALVPKGSFVGKQAVAKRVDQAPKNVQQEAPAAKVAKSPAPKSPVVETRNVVASEGRSESLGAPGSERSSARSVRSDDFIVRPMTDQDRLTQAYNEQIESSQLQIDLASKELERDREQFLQSIFQSYGLNDVENERAQLGKNQAALDEEIRSKLEQAESQVELEQSQHLEETRKALNLEQQQIDELVQREVRAFKGASLKPRSKWGAMLEDSQGDLFGDAALPQGFTVSQELQQRQNELEAKRQTYEQELSKNFEMQARMKDQILQKLLHEGGINGRQDTINSRQRDLDKSEKAMEEMIATDQGLQEKMQTQQNEFNERAQEINRQQRILDTYKSEIPKLIASPEVEAATGYQNKLAIVQKEVELLPSRLAVQDMQEALEREAEDMHRSAERDRQKLQKQRDQLEKRKALEERQRAAERAKSASDTATESARLKAIQDKARQAREQVELENKKLQDIQRQKEALLREVDQLETARSAARSETDKNSARSSLPPADEPLHTTRSVSTGTPRPDDQSLQSARSIAVGTDEPVKSTPRGNSFLRGTSQPRGLAAVAINLKNSLEYQKELQREMDALIKDQAHLEQVRQEWVDREEMFARASKPGSWTERLQAGADKVKQAFGWAVQKAVGPTKPTIPVRTLDDEEEFDHVNDIDWQEEDAQRKEAQQRNQEEQEKSSAERLAQTRQFSEDYEPR